MRRRFGGVRVLRGGRRHAVGLAQRGQLGGAEHHRQPRAQDARRRLPRRAVEPRKSQSQTATRGAATPTPAKLSYKDKYALENLPKRIAALHDEITAHNKVLADGALFSRNPHTFEAAATGLKQAEAALEAAEDQWLTLELAREEAENP